MMKQPLLLLLTLWLMRTVNAQSGFDYTKAILDRIVTADSELTARFKDSLAVRRVETGILSQSKLGMSASTERTLLSGKTYLLHVFTDRRAMDLKMNIYSNKDNEWRLLKTIDKNQNTSKAADNLYGDYELYDLAVDSTMNYRVEITAPAGSAAGYGMIIWSKDVPPQAPKDKNAPRPYRN